MKKSILSVLLFATIALSTFADSLSLSSDSIKPNLFVNKEAKVFVFDVKEEIGPPVWRKMQKAFEQAKELKSDLILLHMNTYGGMVIHADSMRTKILHSDIPVYVFIDNNAASAGALIAISCDSIYMRSGANIGVATVVDQSGEVLPDKYQSYMRSTMRSTAEANGRDPMIAQAMVDPSIYIEGIIDSGKVLTFTAKEAMQHGFCEGMAEDIKGVLKLVNIKEYKITRFEPTRLDNIIGWLISPAVSGILIMLIIGGIYFEIQSPGLGLAGLAAVIGALLYFAPLYLEGLAANWEILVFFVGVILLGIEIFALPGFGVAGISGIILMISALILSLVENVGFDFDPVSASRATEAVLIVFTALLIAIPLSVFLGYKFLNSSFFGRLALNTVQETSQGYSSVDIAAGNNLVGKTGTAFTVLRPSGKISIEGEIYDATALAGYIEKGETIKVVKFETAQAVVVKV
jgi:membrane-bound serine protease (ClpP class)